VGRHAKVHQQLSFLKRSNGQQLKLDIVYVSMVNMRQSHRQEITTVGFSAFAMAERLVVRDRCLLCKYNHGGAGRRHEWLVLWRSGALSFFRQSKNYGHK